MLVVRKLLGSQETPVTPSRMATKKRQIITTVVKKWRNENPHSYIAGRGIKWYRNFGKQFGHFLQS